MYHDISIGFYQKTILLIRRTSPHILKSLLLGNHFGWSINVGTWGLNHASSRYCKPFLFSPSILVISSDFYGDTRFRSLFILCLSLFGIIKPIFSKSLTRFPNASDRYFTEMEISADTVFQCNTSSLWYDTLFSNNYFTSSTFPLNLCPSTGKMLDSTIISFWHFPLIS